MTYQSRRSSLAGEAVADQVRTGQPQPEERIMERWHTETLMALKGRDAWIIASLLRRDTAEVQATLNTLGLAPTHRDAIARVRHELNKQDALAEARWTNWPE